MQQPSPIADYLDALARELRFDAVLALRVRAEVEDHLAAAAADAGAETTAESERRAVANFGAPQMLARQFAAASLLAQLRNGAGALVLALAAIYLAMKARVAWYVSMQWEFGYHASANAIGLPIDRDALVLAFASALIGWGAIAVRRAPSEFRSDYGKALGRRLLICSIAGAAMALAVGTETVLTTLRLVDVGFSTSTLVPALLLAMEIAVAGLLIRQLLGMRRRLSAAASLLGDTI